MCKTRAALVLSIHFLELLSFSISHFTCLFLGDEGQGRHTSLSELEWYHRDPDATKHEISLQFSQQSHTVSRQLVGPGRGGMKHSLNNKKKFTRSRYEIRAPGDVNAPCPQ